MDDLKTIIDNFSFLSDWEDRYGYLIELGKQLTPLKEDERNESTKVSGCASQVWLVQDQKDPVFYRGDSDAHIVKGLIALVLAFYNGKTRDDIVDQSPLKLFTQLDLKDHISQQRANGLSSIISRIQTDARID